MHNVLILGICPSNKRHVYGKSKNITLGRLSKWSDLLDIGFFGFSNLILEHSPKPNVKIIDKELIMSYISDNTIILALGNFVSDSLKKMKIDHFKLPHPSGLNRKLNDKEYVKRILRYCKFYIRRNKHE